MLIRKYLSAAKIKCYSSIVSCLTCCVSRDNSVMLVTFICNELKHTGPLLNLGLVQATPTPPKDLAASDQLKFRF